MELERNCSAITSTKKPHTNPDPKAKPGSDLSLPPFLVKKENQKPRTRGDQETKYKECQKNHAVSTGGHVVDGCCEFMPGGEEGTLSALKCAACSCHRSFHWKEVSGHSNSTQEELIAPAFYRSGSLYKAMVQQGGVYQKEKVNENGLTIMRKKKRIRTKINEEQKEKMKEFAERLGWRILKKDDEEIDKFCRLVNLRRQVFKVWLHNNKQAMKRNGNTCDLQNKLLLTVNP